MTLYTSHEVRSHQNEDDMTDFVTHHTAATHLVAGDGLRYAYRALGPAGGIPLVLCQRFRGTMDDWDPAVIDALAAERRVILFDNAGIGLSTGETPDSIKDMADRVAEFLRLIEFTHVDLLGFSLGGWGTRAIGVQTLGVHGNRGY
jgi:pimeloyl-ACP methyl ester carboxylesterase